jgi:pimeloyl-ACP methyl ester carboxylesterase
MPDTFLEPASRRRDFVIALHCSGASPHQWAPLATALGPDFDLSAPTYFGSEQIGPWPGETPFALADEAASSLSLIDSMGGKIHLVGHSYGGALALHIARERPERVASLALYEPSAFHLLKQIDGADQAFAEIAGISEQISASVARSDDRDAARNFVEYWGGPAAWAVLRPSVKQALTRWIPKAPLDFRALFEEPTPLAAYTNFDFPVLLLRGENSPRPSRLIVEALAAALPMTRLHVIAGAGHMGPLTHPEAVAAAIALRIADARVSPSRIPPFVAR